MATESEQGVVNYRGRQGADRGGHRESHLVRPPRAAVQRGRTGWSTPRFGEYLGPFGRGDPSSEYF